MAIGIEGAGGVVRETAPAKVNLTLEVLGRRPDGYHDICTVMQRITMADTLELAAAADVRLECSDPSLNGPDNLVWRAAELLRRECGVACGASMRLVKRIPVAAGLGGGSSDAAAALRGLVRLWSLRLSGGDLLALGAQLGSDVPFFLVRSACALAEGRGERLQPLPPLPARWLALVKPGVGISAGSVYGAFPPDRWSDGRRTMAWLEAVRERGIVPPPFNDLEPVALGVERAAAEAWAALVAAGAPSPVMAGSGSAFFALFETEPAARAVCRRLRDGGWRTVHVAAFADR